MARTACFTYPSPPQQPPQTQAQVQQSEAQQQSQLLQQQQMTQSTALSMPSSASVIASSGPFTVPLTSVNFNATRVSGGTSASGRAVTKLADVDIDITADAAEAPENSESSSMSNVPGMRGAAGLVPGFSRTKAKSLRRDHSGHASSVNAPSSRRRSAISPDGGPAGAGPNLNLNQANALIADSRGDHLLDDVGNPGPGILSDDDLLTFFTGDSGSSPGRSSLGMTMEGASAGKWKPDTIGSMDPMDPANPELLNRISAIPLPGPKKEDVSSGPGELYMASPFSFGGGGGGGGGMSNPSFSPSAGTGIGGTDGSGMFGGGTSGTSGTSDTSGTGGTSGESATQPQVPINLEEQATSRGGRPTSKRASVSAKNQSKAKPQSQPFGRGRRGRTGGRGRGRGRGRARASVRAASPKSDGDSESDAENSGDDIDMDRVLNGRVPLDKLDEKAETALRKQLDRFLADLQACNGLTEGLSSHDRKKIRNRKASRVSRLKKKLSVYDLQRNHTAAMQKLKVQATTIDELTNSLRAATIKLQTLDPGYEDSTFRLGSLMEQNRLVKLSGESVDFGPELDA